MKLYIPSIGDRIFLTKPWTFDLHQEGRNSGLFRRVFAEHVQKGVTLYEKYRCIQTHDGPKTQHSSSWWSGPVYQKGDTKSVLKDSDQHIELEANKCWEFVGENAYKWKKNQWPADPAVTTLPIATELIVDRIYIKKGAPAYDSVTWRIGRSPKNPKLSKARFWTKLYDVNQIECELYPIVDPASLEKINDRFEELEE